MKKLLMTLAAAASMLTLLTFTTGCDANLDIGGNDDGSPKVVDNIPVNPGDWQEYRVDGLFDHYFVDIPIRELTSYVINNGFYYTYWKYKDGQVGVQEGEGATIYLERFEDGRWILYSETISCSYEVGSMRISLSRSDFFAGRPQETLYFRFVAIY